MNCGSTNGCVGDLEVYLIWIDFYWFNILAEDDLKTSRNVRGQIRHMLLMLNTLPINFALK